VPDRLFTPRFLTMFAYSATVFISLFQLLPSAPYRVLELGGSTAAAGLFLGLLTYSSAFSAPITGSIADRVGQRRTLIVVSLVVAACSASYAFISRYEILLVVVVVHGLFWSGLLSASGAYMTATIPVSRRAEGLSYWGLASVTAIAAAPPLGFWVASHGWSVLCIELVALNLVMALIAWRLPDDRVADAEHRETSDARSTSAKSRLRSHPFHPANLIEWKVLVLSVSLSMISFGYGGLTSFSALFADELSIAPRSLFLTAMAASILLGRVTIGRTLDRIGHRRVLLPALVAPPLGLFLLSLAQGTMSMAIAALVFGAGFGLMYPAYTAYVMNHVAFSRRGAAFGAMLAAFDTGIGTGSSTMGWLIHQFGYRRAFAVAAGFAFLALPSFLVAERKLGYRR
jgi:MFS family permease